ncbi:hypothetical protein Tco_0741465 [Tanacetum coccineum]
MLEMGSYTPWASRFRRYLNRKRENQKWLLKALDEGPYEFKNFVSEGSTIPRLQTAEDLEGDDLLLHDAEMEVMNMILLSIPNEIYNSVDACTSVKDMWKQVEQLMRGTIQNKVDRETRFMNEFDQFVAEPGKRFRMTVHKSNSKGSSSLLRWNSGNNRRNSRRAYVQEEVVEGMNAPNETGNVQRTLRTPSSGKTSAVQCYNCSGIGTLCLELSKQGFVTQKVFHGAIVVGKSG